MGIPVSLKDGRTILMTIRSDYNAQDHSVVFADPKKLAPYMDALKAKEVPFMQAKRKQEGQQMIDAAVTKRQAVPGAVISVFANADEKMMGMARVSCFAINGEPPRIGFSDGVRRTTELVAQGAAFVPLQVPTKEARLLQEAVGGNLSPQPAAAYVLPDEVYRERMLAEYRTNQQGGQKKPGAYTL